MMCATSFESCDYLLVINRFIFSRRYPEAEPSRVVANFYTFREAEGSTPLLFGTTNFCFQGEHRNE